MRELWDHMVRAWAAIYSARVCGSCLSDKTLIAQARNRVIRAEGWQGLRRWRGFVPICQGLGMNFMNTDLRTRPASTFSQSMSRVYVWSVCVCVCSSTSSTGLSHWKTHLKGLGCGVGAGTPLSEHVQSRQCSECRWGQACSVPP